jgi:hypothetical protein
MEQRGVVLIGPRRKPIMNCDAHPQADLKLTQDDIAMLIDIPQSLVNRYAKLQERQREYAKRQRQGEPQGATIAAATMVAA